MAELSRIDRTGWVSGPWDNEPDDLEWRDNRTGLPCLIRRNQMGALCGYVGVPNGHPWYRKGYDDIPVDVHGGLTYANHCSGHICHTPAAGEPDDVWWLGFDCTHWGDSIPLYRFAYLSGNTGESYKNISYVQHECQRLALQITQYTWWKHVKDITEKHWRDFYADFKIFVRNYLKRRT